MVLPHFHEKVPWTQERLQQCTTSQRPVPSFIYEQDAHYIGTIIIFGYEIRTHILQQQVLQLLQACDENKSTQKQILFIMVVPQLLALVVALVLGTARAVSTFAPTWVTSSYVQANSKRLIDGDVTFTTVGNNVTPTATIPFTTPFTAVPNLGYGVSNYQGHDTLNNEMFEVNRTGLTTTDFSVLIQISGFTNIWVMEVRFIAISRSFPHHLNSFDNVPINYNGPPITNLSMKSSVPITYTNTIDYSAQAAATGSTYTTFSTPLSNNKILLFITSLFIVGSQGGGGLFCYNFYIDAFPVSTTTYTLDASFEINGNISRLHFSMIVFDQADVESSGQYSLIYDRPCYSNDGGFYAFPLQFLTNFMIGWVEWSSPRHGTIIHFINTFGTVNSTYGVKMEPISVRNTNFPALLNRTCFTVFYLKTWICPNNTLFDPAQDLCTTCPVANCLDCLNFTACSVCDASTQHFLNFSKLLCEPCALAGCLNCSSLEACQECDNASDYGFDFTSPNMSLCGGCDVSCICDGYGLPWNTATQNCTPICGDGLIRVDEKCDDNNTDSFDGCSSSCQVEQYYVCDDGEPTICNQTLFIEAEFLGIVKEGCNGFKITVMTPRFTAGQIAQNIHIVNSGVTVLKAEQNGSAIEIFAEYSRDIANETIQLHFSPGELLSITYSPSVPALYYSQSECEASSQVRQLLQGVQVMSYAILFVSILSCKIVGLELFGVLQLAYFTLSSHSFLNMYLAPIVDFRTFNGLNIGLVAQTSRLPQNYVKMGVAAVFINNFNLMFFLMAGWFVATLLAYIVSRLTLRQKMEKVCLRLMKQGFITLVLFNIFNVAFSAGVHWKYASPADEGYAISTVVLVITLATMLISVVAMEFTSQEEYGEFKTKFKDTFVCRLFIPLTVVYRMVLGFYTAVKADDELSTLVILSFSIAFMLYMITNLPFSEAVQNYRSCLVHVAMAYTLMTTNYYRAMKSNTPMEIKGRIYAPAIAELVLVLVCVAVSLCTLAYEFYRLVREALRRRRIQNKKLCESRQATFESFCSV